MVLDAQSLEFERNLMRVLIISDDKAGHVNQSIALAMIMDWEWELFKVKYKSRLWKKMSYFFDLINISAPWLYKELPSQNNYDLLISTGSETYYANKILSKKWQIINIAIQYPRGYRINFTHIFCPFYDYPQRISNITTLPVNITYSDELYHKDKANEFIEKKYRPKKKAIGIIIGGSNSRSIINHKLKDQLIEIFKNNPDYEYWITTSRRTEKETEDIINEFKFDYKLIWRNDRYNPVPAFIQLCDKLFITDDSASMISEAVSYGNANVIVIETINKTKRNKLKKLTYQLVADGYACFLSDTNIQLTKKINVENIIKKSLKNLHL